MCSTITGLSNDPLTVLLLFVICVRDPSHDLSVHAHALQNIDGQYRVHYAAYLVNVYSKNVSFLEQSSRTLPEGNYISPRPPHDHQGSSPPILSIHTSSPLPAKTTRHELKSSSTILRNVAI